jgi:hypothetical protein
MAFNPGDPVFACLPTLNEVAVDQTDTGLRVYRDTISTPGQWNIGDTIKIKDATFVFFGYNDAKLATKPLLQTSTGSGIELSVSGTGSGEVTITLSATAPAGDTLTLGYRAGIPSTYVELLQDRKNDDIDIHKTTLNGGAKSFVDVYNHPHKYFGTNATVAEIVQVDGLSIQTNPAT